MWLALGVATVVAVGWNARNYPDARIANLAVTGTPRPWEPLLGYQHWIPVLQIFTLVAVVGLLLWTPETLFLRFHCNYKNITVFPDARADGWRYELWDRDVAETFLQPDSSDPFVYREFEVSPNGYWIDLAVSHGKIEELHSGLRRRVVLDEKAKSWTAEMAIPMKYLTTQFDPKASWRVNFFRIEGEKESRFYAAWSPTYSPKPNFHVPSAFGTLSFQE